MGAARGHSMTCLVRNVTHFVNEACQSSGDESTEATNVLLRFGASGHRGGGPSVIFGRTDGRRLAKKILATVFFFT
jgi:hypothetical protein